MSAPLCLVLAVAASAAILLGGRAPASGGIVLAHWDKVGHGALYLLVGTAYALGLRGRKPLLAAAIAASVAAADELHQLFLPHREASVADFVADMLGIGFAALIVARAIDRGLVAT